MSKNYEAAVETARDETKRFNKAQTAYRAQLIGDVEFLAARKRHELAQAAFDIAFNKEAS